MPSSSLKKGQHVEGMDQRGVTVVRQDAYS